MKTLGNLDLDGGSAFARISHEEIDLRSGAHADATSPFIQPLGGSVRAVEQALKRLIDIVGAATALILLTPSMLIVALAIRLTSSGPVFFRQMRTGLGGEPFLIYKFRTMHVLEDGEDIRHASRDDPRITRIGSFLRRTSIDELPQLLNVLRGEMSLVGPRPHALAHDILYSQLIPHYRRRFSAKPGMTGLAQIRGLRGEIHSIACMRGRVDADCEYITHWSLWSDIAIILRTVPRLLHDTKAY